MEICKDAVVKGIGTPEADELALINSLARRELGADEVYTFALRLCDNDIDRDFERFDDAALDQLAPMFVGVSGVFDHQWSAAMQAGRDGAVRDFVCAGDVDIRTIGADNQILDSEVPVRQILEQLVAKTGIPPFLLGLSWSSTERMSSQQADIMTSEIAAIRRSLEPVVERICEFWLRLKGFDDRVVVNWLDVNLQDEESESRAALYRAQARALGTEEENENGDL